MKRYKEVLQKTLKNSLDSMSVLPDMFKGELSHQDMQLAALNHYAETRAFLDVKLPARLYLCPHNAMSAKKYFNHLYVEEQGEFGKDLNHAELFVPVCFDLGLSREQLDNYYVKCQRYYSYLFSKEPNIANMVEELAISYVWESMTPYFGIEAMRSFESNYNLSSEAMQYFELHFHADDDHSEIVEKTLLEYVNSDHLLFVAQKAMETTLGEDLYLKRRL